MSDAHKTKVQLIDELAALRKRVADLEHSSTLTELSSPQPSADEQTALYNIALLLSAQLETGALLNLLIEQAVALLDVTAGGFYRYDEERDRLVLAVGVDFLAAYIGTELNPGENLPGRAFQGRKVMTLTDYQAWEGRSAAYRHEVCGRAALAAPLLGRQAPLGVLLLVDQRPGRFTQHDGWLIERLAAQAAIALENALIYARQQEQSQRMQEAQSRLIYSEKMSALGRLIASISHEINNPLQAIQGCLTLVHEGISENTVISRDEAADWLRDLAMASSEVQRITAIVQRLRDFYRPVRIGLQPTGVAAMLDAVLALTAKQIQHSRIHVDRIVLDGTPGTITTNADLVKQVILNLVLNAIDAMPHGGRLRILTAADRLGGNARSRAAVRIEFADTGQGIATDNLPRIFEPFFSTKETGTGLGLSISSELIKSLGGEIHVASEVGVGTTFTICLPVEPDKTGGQS